jgi:hypothetical protein
MRAIWDLRQPSDGRAPARRAEPAGVPCRKAAEALRALIDEVRLISKPGEPAIELIGDLAGILALSAPSRRNVTGCKQRWLRG